jgi:hypothetical protein
MSLIISKQLPHTLSNVFAICTITNFYADLRNVAVKNKLKELDFRKLRRAANIKIFNGIKNFLFTCFFLLRIQLGFRMKNSFFNYKTHARPE